MLSYQVAPSRYEAVNPQPSPSASSNRYRASSSGGTVIGGGKNFDVVESYSAPTGRTVMQPGLLPIRYERLPGAVASSAYEPARFNASAPSFGRTYLPLQAYGRMPDATAMNRGPIYASSTVYSSTLHHPQQAQSQQLPLQQTQPVYSQPPPERQYRAWTAPRQFDLNTVPPYTSTLRFSDPPVAALNGSQGHIPGYGGHVAQAQFQFGKGYGPTTSDCLARFPQGKKPDRFAPVPATRY